MSHLVLITGGSRGIGAATALSFARAGWNVAFSYLRSEDEAETLRRRLALLGVDALAVRADAGDSAAAASFVKQAVSSLGTPEALVCNAGIALKQDVITNVSDEAWRRLFAVNVDGVFYTIRALLPFLLREKRGSIVTLASMWGQTGGSCEAAYSAAKGAVIVLTRALAKELGPSGIRVNCVSPGVIGTEMNAHLSDADLAALAEETPLGRIGTADEVARCIRFLCTDDARFLTGQILAPNGGLVI